MTEQWCKQAVLLMALVGAIPAQAAVPQQFAAQGRLENSAGLAVDGVYDLIVALYDDPISGTKLWSQTYSALAVTEGHFQLLIGASFNQLPIAALAGGNLYLGIAVAGEPELARARIVSTPYSLFASSADTAGGLACTGCVSSTHLAAGAVASSAVTFTGAASGLAAADVQAAIDELAGRVTALSSLVTDLQVPVGVVLPTCNAGAAGRLFLDSATGQLRYCDGADWRPVGLGSARLEFTPVVLDFDQVSATVLGATLRNTGDDTANNVALEVTGDFLLSEDCPATLAPGAACTATFEMRLDTGKTGKLAGGGTATAEGGLTAAVVLVGTPPSPRSCREQLDAKSGLPDGLYIVDFDGLGGESPATVYCDMTTDGGGWTLAAYCGSAPGSQNFWDLRCGGGDYDGNNRGSCASLPSVPLGRRSTEMLLARSDSNAQSGNILAYAVATKFAIPDPEHVNFINHSRYGPFTGTDITQRGPCTEVTLTTLKGPSFTGTKRYTYAYSLGTSWNDSYPTGYGVNPNSNCSGQWTQGPFFTSVHSGSGHPTQPGPFTNACVTNGRPTYDHQGWYDTDTAFKAGSASIWFR